MDGASHEVSCSSTSEKNSSWPLTDLNISLNIPYLDVPDRKLGSMVRINGLFHPFKNGVY